MAAPLHLEIIDRPDDPRLPEFHAAYEAAFVLPDETEDLAGFKACLALNSGAEHARLAARYGDFREVCLLARDRHGGPLAGAANLLALRHALPAGTMYSANLNYIFVPAAQRGRGLFSRLAAAIPSQVPALFGDAAGDAPVLVFIELNDPLRMDAATYQRDSTHSGLDQFDRLRIWAGRGAQVVDLAYVQPPLSTAQRADDGLAYAVLGTGDAALDACFLIRHLRAFFGISVLKGAPPEAEPAAAAQLAVLDALCAQGGSVDLLDPRPMLATLGPSGSAALVADPQRPRTLRDWLRAAQASNEA